MEKIKISIVSIAFAGLELPTIVRADLVAPSPILVGGVLLVAVGVVVVVIGLIAWLIIRAIKRANSGKKNPASAKKIDSPSKKKK